MQWIVTSIKDDDQRVIIFLSNSDFCSTFEDQIEVKRCLQCEIQGMVDYYGSYKVGRESEM